MKRNILHYALLVGIAVLTTNAYGQGFDFGVNENGGLGIRNTVSGFTITSLTLSFDIPGNDTFYDTASTPPGTASTGWSIQSASGVSVSLPSNSGTDGLQTATISFSSFGLGDFARIGFDLDRLADPDGSGDILGDDPGGGSIIFPTPPSPSPSPAPAEVTVNFSGGYSLTESLTAADITIGGGFFDFSVQGVLPSDPELTTSPTNGSTIDFGNVLVGNPETSAIGVENTGDVASSLSGTFPGASGDFSPSGSDSFGPLGQNGTDSRDYTYDPGTVGSDSQNITITSNGGNSTLTLSGTGVAPVQSIDDSNSDAGNVRVGTSGNASFSITNIGNGNTNTQGLDGNLVGTVAGSTGEFSGLGGSVDLGDSGSQSFSYTYTPSSRGADSTTVTVSFDNGNSNLTNTSQNVEVSLNGTGVGPVFDSNHGTGGTIDVGAADFVLGTTATTTLSIENITPDGDLGTLTDLSILGYSVTGADADDFSVTVADDADGGVIHADSGDTFDLLIEFFPDDPLGEHTALLTVFTDQNAAFGVMGDIFTFNLSAISNPEPASMAVWGLIGMTVGGCSYWRRRQRKARK